MAEIMFPAQEYCNFHFQLQWYLRFSHSQNRSVLSVKVGYMYLLFNIILHCLQATVQIPFLDKLL